MQTAIEQLAQSSDQDLRFTDAQVNFMLKNVGNLDPHLRDKLVYTLFARGFNLDAFTSQQVETIIATFIKEQNLFKGIGQPQNDLVFLRTFSALLGGLIIDKDSKQAILADKQRQLLFDWSIAYLNQEKDYRGFVPGKGWAHAVAHGSDFLSATLSHQKFTCTNEDELFTLIKTIWHNMQAPFIDDEEQRIASAFYLGVHAGNVTSAGFTRFVCQFDTSLNQEIDWAKQVDWYRLSSWQRLLQNWYFFFSQDEEIRTVLNAKIMTYYTQMGYQVD
ncbi:DUF2785 domain-containing protein [Lactobacillus xylocopicola]|uniref:DUF2785 domain-containing protein n=1 Tax=Lactobacillus xylocopicola TaxID=2976676 RepID=A0ABM8BHZ3_9LACO|nr:DUF2785 domain-containing protein [Lactobacillus xylocopicola]BDR60921.1 hypothetical protein KIM322_11820 [Lactobacillus xylocopicola]